MKQRFEEPGAGTTLATTRVVFSEEARRRLLVGMKVAADAVGCTLGPRGMTVLIAQADGPALATKDGVTVSRSIRLSDPIERMGADLIKEAASRTNDVAGDGTTTATVLTHAMTAESGRLMAAGLSSTGLRRGIELGSAAVDAHLRASAREIEGKDEVAQIGTVSANGDARIGALIAEAMERVGRDGIVTVEDAKGMTTSLEVVEGMRFDSGYLSPYFVTHRERMHAVHDDGYVLLAQGKLDDMHTIVGLLEQVHKERKPLLIVADEVEGAALQALIVNRVNSDLRVVAVKAPGYGPVREAFMQDIAVLTGTRVAGAGGAAGPASMKAADLGRCKRIVVDARTTTIVGLGTTKDAVAARVGELRAQLADPTLDDHAGARLKERIARLASGVAVVKVGGATELEMVERRHRIEDALHATRAAVEEGVVPGGGTALFAAARNAGAELALAEITKDERAGAELVLKACSAPLRRIAQNAGEVPEVVLERTAALPTGQGFNAGTGAYEDLIASGVIDPVKVCRTALKHAASVACIFTTLDAVVVPVEEGA